MTERPICCVCQRPIPEARPYRSGRGRCRTCNTDWLRRRRAARKAARLAFATSGLSQWERRDARDAEEDRRERYDQERER